MYEKFLGLGGLNPQHTRRPDRLHAAPAASRDNREKDVP
jgi:hypothetical protein